EYGTVKLVGLDENKIFNTAKELIENKKSYNEMATAVNPYGDGLASKRILQAIKNYFGFSKTKVKEFIP
ncbi:MAG: UDP-N-acetylglucosamine 2-epimerase, partial [Ignavibacteria bacterium]|nr:UDP-N-acetylglucosamine 2-epimerase [Ignavibacteria bacterium]